MTIKSTAFPSETQCEEWHIINIQHKSKYLRDALRVK